MPGVGAVGFGLAGPSGFVVDDVVMSAEGVELVGVGETPFRIGGAMVEVAAGGGDATSGEDTGLVSDFDLAAHRLCGSAAGEDGVDGQSLVGDGDLPLVVRVELGEDVFDDRSVSGDLDRLCGRG